MIIEKNTKTNKAKNIIDEEFRLKGIDKKSKYFIEEKKQKKIINKKCKKICKTLNYPQHLRSKASTVTGYISIPAFGSLVGIPIGIANSAALQNLWPITAGMKKYKSITKKIKKKHDNIVFLKLRTIRILTMINLFQYKYGRGIWWYEIRNQKFSQNLILKTFTVFNLVFGSNTILSCFFFFFLVIDLYFLISGVVGQIFIFVAEFQ